MRNMNIRKVSQAIATLSVVLALVLASSGQTYIRAVLPNPSPEQATGYRFEMLTPGNVLDAVVRQTPQQGTDAIIMPASLPAQTTTLMSGIRQDARTILFPFEHPIAANGRIDVRIAFAPRDYWRVYFRDVFKYADGRTVRSRIPYAAFFITFVATKDPKKVKASLTIVNNVASSYGIPSSEVDDGARLPITFHNAHVYINNSLKHHNLTQFDQPDGSKVDLPTSFTLKAGGAQTFDLGLVNANSYVLTLSEISYEGSDEVYPIACSHEPDQDEGQQASYKIYSPAK
jgi:hypothetical protein